VSPRSCAKCTHSGPGSFLPQSRPARVWLLGFTVGHGLAHYPVSNRGVLYGGQGINADGAAAPADTWNGYCSGSVGPPGITALSVLDSSGSGSQPRSEGLPRNDDRSEWLHGGTVRRRRFNPPKELRPSFPQWPRPQRHVDVGPRSCMPADPRKCNPCRPRSRLSVRPGGRRSI
jgi:hypothetical protein